MSEEKDFKVTDRRFSAGATDEPSTASKAKPASQKGEGFEMREAPSSEEGHPPNQIDFSTFIFSLATGALINLGLAPDPITKQTQKNVELSRQNIEILALLKEKTKGNLSADEDKLLESLLTEVRLRYVEATKKG